MREVTFLGGSAPPIAARYLSNNTSGLGKEDLSIASPAIISGIFSSAEMTGMEIGFAAPRWQEKQVTERLPSKLSLLMFMVLSIIWRASLFSFLSSFSQARSTWQ